MSIFQSLTANNFDDLKGSELRIRLPVRTHVVNAFLSGINLPKAVKKVTLVAIKGLELEIRITIDLLVSIDQTVRLRLVENARGGTIQMEFLQDIMRVLARLFSGKFPEGITLKGSLLTVDLPEFLKQNKATAPYAHFVKDVDFEGGQGMFMVKALIKI